MKKKPFEVELARFVVQVAKTCLSGRSSALEPRLPVQWHGRTKWLWVSIAQSTFQVTLLYIVINVGNWI